MARFENIFYLFTVKSVYVGVSPRDGATEIAGLDSNGRSGKDGHCRTGHCRTGLAGVDIVGLNISGRVCESELGNMLSF